MRVENRSNARGRGPGRRKGGSAVELVLVAPVLCFMLVGAIDFCRVFFAYTTITNAARNGAVWASDPFANGTVTPSQSPYATVQAAAMADANNLSPALTTSNVTQTAGTDANGNVTVIVTVQYQFPLITSFLGLSNVSLSRQVTMRTLPKVPNP
jgi:Flp pilus assembly protein TadG